MEVSAAMLAAIAALFIAGFSSAVETETFIPAGAVSHLQVNSDVEGDITWHSNSASNLTLMVTLSTDDTLSIRPTIEFSEDPATGTVVLNILSCKTSSGNAWSAGLKATLGLALFSAVLVTRLSSPTLCLLALGVFVGVSTLHVSADGSTQSADVAILVPRDYSFTSISLVSERGSIAVDKTLLSTDPNIKCVSGTSREDCGSCCQANGQCISGQCQCRSRFTGKECETQTDTIFTLRDDPTDPVIMTLGTVEGEELQILGDKDSNGIPSSVESLILDDRLGSRTFVNLNKTTSLPDRVSTESGARIHFEWSDDLSMVHVTAVSQDGRLQVTVNVDLNSTVDKTDLKRDVNERIYFQSAKRKRQSEEGNIASIPVVVTQCDQPETNARVYAKVLLNYDEDTSEWMGEGQLQAVSTDTDGEYHIQIFTGTVSPIAGAVESFCEQVVTVLESPCDIVSIFTEGQEEIICNEIEAASMELTMAVSGDFDIVNRACDATFQALRIYCETFGQPPPGGQSLTEHVCESVSLSDSLTDLFESDNIFILPYAEFPDGNRVESEGQLLEITPGTTGLLPYSFTIQDDRAEPVVTSLIVTPEDPHPREDYAVNVTYICPTMSLNVTMHIVGTDNYTDTNNCTGLTFSCTLSVPGAEELVRDLVTVQLSDPVAGYSFTRQVVVVF